MFKNKWKHLQSQEREGNFTHSYVDIIPVDASADRNGNLTRSAKFIYDELKSYLYVKTFPISYRDNLYETLGIDADEVDDIISIVVKQILGGKFVFCGDDRRIPHLSTAGDLVRFVTSSVESGLFKKA